MAKEKADEMSNVCRTLGKRKEDVNIFLEEPTRETI
jgi:hypothetical protein